MQNAKKRILCIVTQAEMGGVQSYLVRFGMEALKRGYEVMIAAGGEGELGKNCHINDISYRQLHKLKREISFTYDFGAIKEMVALIKEWKPDVLYLHSSKAGVVGSIAGRIAGVRRIVYRIGGWSFLDPVSPLQKRIRILSEQLTAPLKNTIITLHPEDEARAKKHHIKPSERVLMIPNALDLEQFDASLFPKEKARAQLEDLWLKGASHASDTNPFTNSTRFLLTVANFYATKDLVRYQEAIALVTKKYPDIRVLLLGEGELRSEIEQKKYQLGLDQVVSLPGNVDQAKQLLSGADLFVLPSAKEGMPWTLLEAMAARIPCIATDVGACKWILEGSGWIIPPKQPDALANAIMQALADPERSKRLGEEGRRTIETRFLEGKMWEETFKALLP